MFNAGNKDSEEPAASPWVKVLRRPGDADANRSEAAPVVREGETPMSTDVSFDVPEKVGLRCAGISEFGTNQL